jgi:hypothetical protein
MTSRHRFDRARVSTILGALLLTAVLTTAAPARAQASDASAFKGWRVSSLSIVGLDGERAGSLRSGLALAQTSGLLVKGRPIFYADVLDQDLSRCSLFLARMGYPYARVTPSFDPHPAKQSVAIILGVVLGPPVIVSSTAVRNVPPDLEAAARREVRLVTGRAFADGPAETSAAAIRTRSTGSIRPTWPFASR